MNGFTMKTIECILQIPFGKVSTYGTIAYYAGNPRGARQVSWILHSMTEKAQLPWHRVVNRQGKISIRDDYGYQMQKALLEDEGVVFGPNDTIDLETYGW